MSASEVDVVPVIDISPTLRADADAAAKQAVIDALGDACARCGFFMVKGHGVPESLIRDFWASARAFFDEPLAVKESCPMTDSYVYGYAGMSTEKAGHEKGADKSYDTSDLKESFQVCLSSEEAPAKGLPTPQWPPSPAGFKELTTAYYRAMEKLAAQLLSLLAQALKVEPDFFDPTLKSHWSSLRILNYPHMTTPPNPGQLRIAPHSDYGAITLLRADDVPGGLQLLMKGGEWKDVVIPPDAYTVNLGGAYLLLSFRLSLIADCLLCADAPGTQCVLLAVTVTHHGYLFLLSPCMWVQT